MNYMVFDLEFNQVFTFNKEHPRISHLRCPFEIIHIGAVKLDENLNEIGTFDKLVKPKLYTRIHPYVKKMTGITREDLRTAQPFKSVYKEFIEFINNVSVLCVFGTSDIKELLRNIEYHKLDTSPIPKEYMDIQHYANTHLEHPKGTSISLSNAASALDIPSELKFHNALNDALYTAEVFKKIFNNQMKPDIYHLHKDRKTDRGSSKKATLDTDRLVKQFEKMFHREMSSEEQTIIKLAYKMGNTNQFER